MSVTKPIAKPKDRLAHIGIGVYSLVHAIWIGWALTVARFGIFDTAIFMGFVMPVLGLISLVVFQCRTPRNRFSLCANILSVLVIGGWSAAVWSIVGAASAAV